jgi:hypothetical protein
MSEPFPPPIAAATSVRFEGDTPLVLLEDSREIWLPLTKYNWTQWLLKATPAQRANWTLEPEGFAVYWPDLDDGFEVRHLLNPHPLT